eukprot:TRINITY_DN49354_c0_g1_i1.p1 TRINITY_DN49354_c0_g1~~TRINITY_DN49354_c0_g1_i1.p1  ORF type:complete len:742 (-),score=417.38 TRINITY_DN49354_c0_g1_i1:127-2136(-)
MKERTFSSSAYGTSTDKDIRIEGRVQFDLLPIMRRNFKLSSYSLNSVSAHFLKQQKEDVHYSIITTLQNGTAETRHRLAVYCLKDALLPLRLLDKLMLLINYIEMARVTGVPITYLITRGQQIKVVSQLLRKAKQRNLLVPVRKRQQTDQTYEGATVLEAKKGYHRLPISTLDFASLYPSIMMAHNLCYSTLLAPADVKKLDETQYTRTPTGDYFVKNDVQRGVLPEILQELLAARKLAKADMKVATDPFTKAVLNGRQLALKVSANSVYGFTGATVGQLPCLEISSSVTSFGREMIEATKKAVEQRYTISNGYAFDAEVVYGDTDSVMVKFGPSDVAECMRLGEEAAEFVSKLFINPIRLEFEKVYFPYLLMSKKRYAGLYWTKPDKWDKMDTKGIETVRRDNCALVRNVIGRCLEELLINKSPERAISYTKKVISDLLMNKLDLSFLVISKSLSRASEDYASKQAHVELAARMHKRDPSTAPKTGDRVPYVIIQGPKGAPAYTKAEDPVYVLENSLQIDSTYYLEKQLKLPLMRIFTPILEGRVKEIFNGDHTRKRRHVAARSNSGIMKFAVKKRTCINCRVPLSRTEKALCTSCVPLRPVLFMREVEKVRNQEAEFSQLWAECQRCQGSLHMEVLCSNSQCPIFYRRMKVKKELAQARTQLERFSF